jgi:hypothetical protein
MKLNRIANHWIDFMAFCKKKKENIAVIVGLVAMIKEPLIGFVVFNPELKK